MLKTFSAARNSGNIKLFSKLFTNFLMWAANTFGRGRDIMISIAYGTTKRKLAIVVQLLFMIERCLLCQIEMEWRRVFLPNVQITFERRLRSRWNDRQLTADRRYWLTDWLLLLVGCLSSFVFFFHLLAAIFSFQTQKIRWRSQVLLVFSSFHFSSFSSRRVSMDFHLEVDQVVGVKRTRTIDRSIIFLIRKQSDNRGECYWLAYNTCKRGHAQIWKFQTNSAAK